MTNTPYFVYILYSDKIDRYYTGFSINVEDRLKEHNEQIIFDNWTKQGAPWILKLKLECKDKTQAIQIERHIKKNKSRLYIQNLIKYSEIADKLKQKHC